MQRDDQFFTRKPVGPVADEAVDHGYIHNASIFGRTVLPPGAKQSRSVSGVEFQLSEGCPRNFVVFDQTANRSQIVFHPAFTSKLCPPGLDIGASFSQDPMDRTYDNKGREISSWQEDSDDINVLLSLEEEEEDECDEEVSTARTHGISGSDSSDSCCDYGSKARKIKLHSRSKSSSSGTVYRGIKREKMKKMVKALRGIVPGANQMNTVDVLDEAVRYLKSLKFDVQNLVVGNTKG